MKIICFIPIKLNNERLPNKNVTPYFRGKNLLELMLEKMEKLFNDDIIDAYYIFCSEQNIENYSNKYRGCRFLLRDKSLDLQTVKSNDLISEFISKIESDIYCMAHVTSPFVEIETYKDCIAQVSSGNYDSSFAAKKINGFVWFNNRPLNFTLDKNPRTQDIDPVYIEISSPYVFRKKIFKEFHGRTSDSPFIREISQIESVDIDTKEDIDFAVKLYNMFEEKKI
jgi:CMP-N-acetylneuraminic acid synthetase